MRITRLVVLSLVTAGARRAGCIRARRVPNNTPGRYAGQDRLRAAGRDGLHQRQDVPRRPDPVGQASSRRARTRSSSKRRATSRRRASSTVAAVRKTQELFVPLVKKADPPKIDVKADADPKGVAGAQVWLDGETKGQAPVTLTTTAGRHLIQLKKDGFETVRDVDQRDRTTRRQTMLPQLKEIAKPKYGTIVVEADVPDAEVYIDGNKHPDNTPAVISNVIEGLHVIEVRKPPSLPWKQTVQVAANKQTKVRAELAVDDERRRRRRPRALRCAGRARVHRRHRHGPGPGRHQGREGRRAHRPGQGARHADRREAGQGRRRQLADREVRSQPRGAGRLRARSRSCRWFPRRRSSSTAPRSARCRRRRSSSAGEHPVVVRLDGYKQFEQKVRIEAGQTRHGAGDAQAGRSPAHPVDAGAGQRPHQRPARRARRRSIKRSRSARPSCASSCPASSRSSRRSRSRAARRRRCRASSRSRARARPSWRRSSAACRRSARARCRAAARRSTSTSAIRTSSTARITVGAGKIAKKFGFDADVGVRTMLARNELGLGGRMMLADNEPFSAGVFTRPLVGQQAARRLAPQRLHLGRRRRRVADRALARDDHRSRLPRVLERSSLPGAQADEHERLRDQDPIATCDGTRHRRPTSPRARRPRTRRAPTS